MVAAAIRPGSKTSLVRWYPTGDGWRTELLTGIYRGRSSDVWKIEIANEERHLPRADWHPCTL
ncbi:hypothetical protein D4765_13970 [Subtercola vilae]|uniref:Uncharacterized protein n=1 Tax=Subtercola vilae TaxID=2056433 RepID=A0A4T2BVG5_9MICO|nr:hypothetical protein D4765_13970 [Subtercola vilae]